MSRTRRHGPALGLAMMLITCTSAPGEEMAASAGPDTRLGLIPRPVVLELRPGPSLAIRGGLAVRTRGRVPAECVNAVLRGVREITTVEPAVAAGGQPDTAPAVTLRLDGAIGHGRPDWQALESYTLSVDARAGAEITASQPHGLFNGIQTLLQLLHRDDTGQWHIPAVKIDDYPRFRWRGYLLDPARHFRPKAELFRAIDLMALHKLNVLQLHLTDDQGWRIEIKRYPKLIEVGSKVPDFSGLRGDGWYYSQDDMKQIVAYAAERFIMVLPEIEMPGHSGAATQSYPELGCKGEPYSPLCVTNPRTFEFAAGVLDEVAGLFPAPFIHVGADEVPPRRWRGCPTCKKRMDELAAEGLPADVERFHVRVSNVGVPFNEDVSLLEGEFVRKLDRHITARGKRMIGWDEILDGGLARDARTVVMAWRSPAAIAGAAGQKRDVVASIYPEYYLDIDVPLASTYAVEPAPADMPKDQAARVLGVQGNMWGEKTPARQDVDRRTFPRLCALAEVGWTPRDRRGFEDFKTRLDGRHRERLKRYDVEMEASRE